jgi:hypothetical protein
MGVTYQAVYKTFLDNFHQDLGAPFSLNCRYARNGLE